MKKKTVLTLAICLAVLQLQAQHIGVKAGLNLANATYEMTGVDIVTSNLAGFHIGVIGEMQILDPVFINTGFLYSGKGTKLSLMSSEVHFPISYVEIPLNIVYKYDVSEARLFAQAGPYAGIGLAARMTNSNGENRLDFGSGITEMKRIDAGFNIGAGIEMGKLQAGVNYGLGLINLANTENETMRNGVFSITVTYFPLEFYNRTKLKRPSRR